MQAKPLVSYRPLARIFLKLERLAAVLGRQRSASRNQNNRAAKPMRTMPNSTRARSVMARKEIDVAECLRRGAIGALSAIPGTLAAHPIDLVKIRIQTGAKARCALPCAGLGTRASDWPRYYRGLGPGVLQKAATRGPMFLASEDRNAVLRDGLWYAA